MRNSRPSRLNSARVRYGLLALLTIGIGLTVHGGARALPFAIRDPLGDALWAAMVYWIVSALRPTAPLLGRSVAAITFSYVVEFSQLYHSVWLDDLRVTTLGQLVLGSGFDVRDLLAYAVGVMIAATIDRVAIASSRAVTPSERSESRGSAPMS